MELAISRFDVVLLVGYLLITLGFGLFSRQLGSLFTAARPGSGKRGVSEEAYLVGGRQLTWWMLLFSIVATETSTVTFLSLPGIAFEEGGNFTFLQITIGYILGRLLVVRYLLPQFYSGQLNGQRFYTAHEVLQQRFGSEVRYLASAMFMVFRTAADGLRLFLTAFVLEAALGLDFTLSVIVLASITAIYSAVGGVTSVVLNDCLQFLLYTIGAVIALVLLLQALPEGTTTLLEFARSEGKLRWIDPTVRLSGGMTIWSGIVGGAFLSLATHGVDHLMVQRYLCARTQRDAALALGLSGPVVALQFLLFLVIGVGLACSSAEGIVDYTGLASDRAFATFLVEQLPSGVRGVVLASVIAAAMSTLSSSLNASAGVAVKDWLQPLMKRRVPLPENEHEAGQTSESKGMVAAARVATLLFGALQAGVAIGAYQFGVQTNVINAVLAIAGFSVGLLLGIYVLGLVVGKAPSVAGITALVCGFAVCGLVVFGTTISWPWFALIGSSTTFLVGLVITKLMPASRATAEELQ